jgi:hypothetical protein
MNTNEPIPTDARLLRLHLQDNVLTVITNFELGETVWISGQPVALSQRLPFGYKVAVGPIAVGEKIIKYGVPIGSATQPIAPGEHVHTHNLKSGYLPTEWRLDHERYFKHGA